MNNLILQSVSAEEFYAKAKEDVVFSIREALDDYKTCRIGLAGGSTPEALYRLLAEEKLPWERIILVTLDERFVPSDHPESNLRMIRKSLINQIPLPPENLVAFDTSLPMESTVKEMGRKLINLMNDRYPLIDLLILGAGADGHVASLFEGDEAMSCPQYACSAMARGYTTPERLTLTLIALKKSARALVLLKGKEKEPVWLAVQDKNPELKLTALRSLVASMPVKILYAD